MRQQYQNFIFFIVLATAFTACEPVEYGETGDPFSKIEGIEGAWIATEVIQVDETALGQGGLYTEQNLTDLFNFTSYSITFDVDANNLPSNFSVTSSGAPSFIDTTGIWTFNDNDFPTEVLLTHPDSSGFTSKMRLITPPRDQNPLRMKFQRFSGGKLIVSYQYTFEKQNQ